MFRNCNLQLIFGDQSHNPALPLNSLCECGSYIYGGGRDGRIFRISTENSLTCEPIYSTNLWISSISISDKYFVAGSYDCSIIINSLNRLSDGKFISKCLHNDYVLSVHTFDNNIISASSMPVISHEIVSETEVKEISKFNVDLTAHSICSKNSEIFCGFINGKIGISDLRDPVMFINGIGKRGSCIKRICVNDNYLVVGRLDGIIDYIDLRTMNKSDQLNCDGSVVALEKQDDRLIVFSSKGKIYIKGENIEVTQIEGVGEITSGCYRKESDSYMISTTKGEIISVTKTGKLIDKINPSRHAVKATRLSHSTDILVQDSEGKITLYSTSNLKEIQSFNGRSFDDVYKSLSQRPSLYFPMSIDISTGVPRAIVPNFLPKVMGTTGIKSRKALRNMLDGLTESKAEVSGVTNFGLVQWTDTADRRLPHWTRYIIEEKFSH